MSVLFAILPARERVEHVLEICRQRRSEFHASAIARVLEDEPLGMEEWPLETADGADVTGDTPVDASVQRIATDRVADRAELHAYLVCAAGMNGNLAQRQSRQVKRLRDSRDRFTCAPRSSRHLLSVHRVAADRRVDAPAGLDDTPDKRDVFLLHFAIVKLAR